MIEFFQYSQKNLASSTVRNSLINFLPKKNAKFNYYKTNNKIKGFYKDKILNDHIYITTSNLKKDVFIRKDSLISTNTELIDLNFVSYFSTIESKVLKFNLFPWKYLNNNIKQFYKKEVIFNKLINKENKLKANELINLDLVTKYKYNYNSLLVVSNDWKKATFLTEKGIIKQIEPIFFNKVIFTGLINILDKTIKEYFQNILELNYLLLIFFSQILTNPHNNNNIKYAIYIYFNLYKFFNKEFSKFFIENKLTLRKSNKFLLKYNLLFKPKIEYILTKLYRSLVKSLVYNTTTNKSFLLNFFIYNKSNLYSNSSYLKKKLFYFLQEQSISFKINLFKHINYILESNLLTKIIKLDVINSLFKYFIFKSLLLKQLFIKNFNFFNIKILTFPYYYLNLVSTIHLQEKFIYLTTLKFPFKESFRLESNNLKKVQYFNYLADIFFNKLKKKTIKDLDIKSKLLKNKKFSKFKYTLKYKKLIKLKKVNKQIKKRQHLDSFINFKTKIYKTNISIRKKLFNKHKLINFLTNLKDNRLKIKKRQSLLKNFNIN